jgi:hypothetical protein
LLKTRYPGSPLKIEQLDHFTGYHGIYLIMSAVLTAATGSSSSKTSILELYGQSRFTAKRKKRFLEHLSSLKEEYDGSMD